MAGAYSEIRLEGGHNRDGIWGGKGKNNFARSAKIRIWTDMLKFALLKGRFHQF